MTLILFNIDYDEVDIVGVYYHDHPNDFYTIIHGVYSMGPRDVLNWYFNGVPIGPSGPYYSVEIDGLNSILQIKGVADRLYGIYTLKIEGTSIGDNIDFRLGKTTSLWQIYAHYS